MSEVNEYARRLLGYDPILRDIRVRGEVSGLQRHSSGHLYFTIKDEGAAMRCACFRQNAQRLAVPVKDGMRVVAGGYVTLYTQTGAYQMVVGSIAPDGAGALNEQFEKTKARLLAEGLFDNGRKRPLPQFAKRIAVVTSPTGAVIKDIVSVARGRWPGIELLLLPVAVQGAAAAGQIAQALARAGDIGDVDVVIVGRGGGSAEDLWPFNEEIVARAVVACPKPVISAVGHDTDFTICDFAADARAATPTHAAQLATPDAAALLAAVRSLRETAALTVSRRMDVSWQRLDTLLSRPVLKAPTAVFAVLGDKKQALARRARQYVTARLAECAIRRASLADRVRALSPEAVLKRGYALVMTDSGPVMSAAALSRGDAITIRMADGEKNAEVL